MTRGPHNPSHEQWEFLDSVLSELHRAFDRSNAEAVLRTCLEAITRSGDSQCSGAALLEALFEYVGPGRRVPLAGEELAAFFRRRIGNGIPSEDGKCQEFCVGDVWYRFAALGGVTLKGKQMADETWAFGTDEDIRFCGCGPSRGAAAANWCNQLHTRFQQLVRKRPFCMSDDEKADWAFLSELIDVDHYRRTTPIKQQETGWISNLESAVYEITWLGSEEVEMLSLENASPEFAGFSKGQWFEALVERNREDYSLSKVIHARPIEPIKEMTDEEWKDWLSSLPTTESLPRSDTDWSTF
jgi:hypothetical protein